ncbi:hypothetical protein LZ30DRAFT_157007 [Colletotrichum cereale]|nr:hypothetical protein LZ30DRAFT_157007 [Colletotrichum cereale]
MTRPPRAIPNRFRFAVPAVHDIDIISSVGVRGPSNGEERKKKGIPNIAITRRISRRRFRSSSSFINHPGRGSILRYQRWSKGRCPFRATSLRPYFCNLVSPLQTRGLSSSSSTQLLFFVFCFVFLHGFEFVHSKLPLGPRFSINPCPSFASPESHPFFLFFFFFPTYNAGSQFVVGTHPRSKSELAPPPPSFIKGRDRDEGRRTLGS